MTLEGKRLLLCKSMGMASELIDWEQLDMMADGYTPDFVEIYREFLDQTPELLRVLEEHVASGDVAGAREIPAAGDPMRGLYEFKEAFGGRWIELAGAHERVARPRRYAAGRATSAAARLARGLRRG